MSPEHYFMTSLQYHCIMRLTEIKTLHLSVIIRVKDAGCAGEKSLIKVLEYVGTFGMASFSNQCKNVA